MDIPRALLGAALVAATIFAVVPHEEAGATVEDQLPSTQSVESAYPAKNLPADPVANPGQTMRSARLSHPPVESFDEYGASTQADPRRENLWVGLR